MATTTTNLLTWEAFEQIPDDCMHREILEGEVFMEAGYKLSDRPATWIQPDVSVLTMERVEEASPDGYFQGGPELAIEVVSPSETARDLNRKIDLLLRNPTLAVWVIYPEEEEVRVFLPDGTSHAQGIGGTLMAPEPFASFEVPVAMLFVN